LRPIVLTIVLTAAAASLGMIPITSEILWGPMAYAIIGGLFVATLLTLLFLPALYVARFRIQQPRKEPETRLGAEAPSGSAVSGGFTDHGPPMLASHFVDAEPPDASSRCPRQLWGVSRRVSPKPRDRARPCTPTWNNSQQIFPVL
jgi:hypothetical protein